MDNSPSISARRPRRERLALGIVAGTLAAVGAGAILMGARPGTSSAAPRDDSNRDLAAAQNTSFDVTTTATGELEALRQIELRSQVEQDTAITEIVKEGVRVKSGDLLIRLNSDTIQTNIDEETLKVETSRAEFATAENAYLIQLSDNDSSIAKGILEIELADLDLKKWLEGEVKSTRQANDLAYERAVRELDRLKEKYERSVTLEKQGFLSRDELKKDEVEYLEAEAALKTAQLNRRVYDEFQFPKDQKTKQSTVDQAKSELERTRRQNDSLRATKEADRSNKRQQLALREQKVAKLREQLAAATINAPSDGLVVYATSVNRDRWGGSSDSALDVGKIVKRNTPLILLPDTSEMVASVRVHESLTGRIHPGQPATVKIDALAGKSVNGEVLNIAVIAESGGMRDPNLREYTVKIKLDMRALDVPLKPSMRCEAEILLDRVSDALTVPIQAVFNEGLVRYVLVPEGSRYRKTPVRIGRRSERVAEVLKGVGEGQQVLVRAATPNELIDEPWSADQLAAVGLKLLPDGRVMPLGGGGAPANAERPPGGAGAPQARPPRAADAGAAPGPAPAR
ncbi:hypothetical protein BH11PLA1_BH11PLA1_18910 [soil metagenome]